MTAEQVSYVDAVLELSNALDRLGARIQRDLNPESESSGGRVEARTVAEFVAFAENCLEVLDDPTVKAAVTGAIEAMAAGRGDNATPAAASGFEVFDRSRQPRRPPLAMFTPSFDLLLNHRARLLLQEAALPLLNTAFRTELLFDRAALRLALRPVNGDGRQHAPAPMAWTHDWPWLVPVYDFVTHYGVAPLPTSGAVYAVELEEYDGGQVLALDLTKSMPLPRYAG